MATYEHAALMQHKDQNGDMHLLYPITKAENVDGLYGDAALTGVPTAPTAAPGTNTTQVATTAFVQQELEDVKKSVSDGKTAVANAITAKGVTTATDATFDTMAANISAIESGSGIGLNVFTQETEPETKEGVWVQTANPHQSILIGSKTYENALENENKLWKEISTLPHSNVLSAAVVIYNNEIHVLGGGYSGSTKHYKWNGSSWVSASTLPYSFGGGCAVVYNNEIHILGCSNSGRWKYHYKWNGSSWTSVSTIPVGFSNGKAVVYNNEIHILTISNYHYKWNGSSWTNLGKTPYSVDWGCAVVYNNEIHFLGGKNDTSNNKDNRRQHYKWNGSSWVSVSTLPYDYGGFSSAVVYNGKIHILGSRTTEYGQAHYKFDGLSWNKDVDMPYNFSGHAVVYNEEIHILGPNTEHSATYTGPPIDSIGSKIAIYQNPSNTSGTYATNFISGVPITGENNKFPSGFDDVYYIDDSGNVEESPTYYGDGTQWIKFKN